MNKRITIEDVIDEQLEILYEDLLIYVEDDDEYELPCESAMEP